MQSGRRAWRRGRGGTLEGVPPQVPSPSVQGPSETPGRCQQAQRMAQWSQLGQTATCSGGEGREREDERGGRGRIRGKGRGEERRGR